MKKRFPRKVILDTKNSKIINFSDHFALFCAFLYQHDHKILDFASKSHKVTTYWQFFIIFVKTVKKWGNLARFEVFSCKSGILSKIWDPSTSKSKIRKNTIMKISEINFYIKNFILKKFGPNQSSRTHFLKSLLFGQSSLVFSIFLKIFTYKA